MFSPSPFERRSFHEQTFYLKRDDLLDSDFSGNKARKFYYFLMHDFPGITRVISSGSNQSNAMYSLSVLARLKQWQFVYVCDHVPSFLKLHPVGNYAKALENGMTLIESSDKEETLRSLMSEQTLCIEEGGRQREAEEGLVLLADELLEDIQNANISEPYLFLPSGTGTTALYLQKRLPFRVYTCCTVGDSDYLKRQWQRLELDASSWPMILESPKKYHYGKLYPELYTLWQALKHDMHVEFDLVYDPIGWTVLLAHVSQLKGTPIYVHQGGLLGNVSMQQRYARKLNML